MPVDIFTIFCTDLEIKFVHKCKVVTSTDDLGYDPRIGLCFLSVIISIIMLIIIIIIVFPFVFSDSHC